MSGEKNNYGILLNHVCETSGNCKASQNLKFFHAITRNCKTCLLFSC